jgi:hypothetical protein
MAREARNRGRVGKVSGSAARAKSQGRWQKNRSPPRAAPTHCLLLLDGRKHSLLCECCTKMR